MNRTQLQKYLKSQGCKLLREGGKHSWWHSPSLNRRSAIPRHIEVNDILAKKICQDLGVKPVKQIAKTPSKTKRQGRQRNKNTGRTAPNIQE